MSFSRPLFVLILPSLQPVRARRDEGEARFRQGLRGAVDGLVLHQVVQREGVHVAGGLDLLLLAEVVEEV